MRSKQYQRGLLLVIISWILSGCANTPISSQIEPTSDTKSITLRELDDDDTIPHKIFTCEVIDNQESCYQVTLPLTPNEPVTPALPVSAQLVERVENTQLRKVICRRMYGQRVCYGKLIHSRGEHGVGVDPVNTGFDIADHFYCYPENPSRYRNQLLMHLVGTTEDPGESFGKIYALQACSEGYATLLPAYPNTVDEFQVFADCTASNATCRVSDALFEKLYGQDLSDLVTYNTNNAVFGRVDKALDILCAAGRFANWCALAADWKTRNLSQVAISGHSQGGFLGFLISRDHVTERSIGFGGPPEVFSEYVNLSTWEPQTPNDRYYAYNHQDDLTLVGDNTQVLENLGLGASCEFGDQSPYASQCRSIVIPANSCVPLLAHVASITKSFSNRCLPFGLNNSNERTWRFFLTNDPL